MIIAYYRVSDDEAGESRSPERQRAQLLAYAAEHFPGLPVEVVGDVGVSAYTETRRRGWLRVLRLLKAGQVHALMATDLSRLHRRSRDAIAFAEEWIVKRGVNLVLLNESVDLTSASGKLAYQVMVAANELHRNLTSDKTKAALAWKRERGEYTGGEAPLGLRVEDRDGVKVLVPDAMEQHTLAMIRDMRLAGHGYRAIASALTRSGVPTKTGLTYWNHKTVARIVASLEEDT